jgi:iron complex transport system ATP-binding protein
MRLIIRDVSFSYGRIRALEGVNFELEERELLALVGPNGSGKSTLIKCVDGILSPSEGLVLVEDDRSKRVIRLDRLSRREIAKLVAYVPQDGNAIFGLRVFDVVLMGRRPHVGFGWTLGERDFDLVSEALRRTKTEHLAMRRFQELSGGERQRVLIARALAQEPRILLLDEPTSNLDIKYQIELLDLIRELLDEKGLSAIMAIHDLNLASRYADRMIMLNGGRIFTAGRPEEVLTPENIKRVYGVEATVMEERGKRYIHIG